MGAAHKYTFSTVIAAPIQNCPLQKNLFHGGSGAEKKFYGRTNYTNICTSPYAMPSRAFGAQDSSPTQER